MIKNWMDVIPNELFGGDKGMSSVGNTGDGGNGIIEPNKPTDMVQSKTGPVMLHEGEGKIHNKDGSVTVVPQSELQAIEKNTGMQGMKTGGTYMPQSTQQQPKDKSYFDTGMEAISATARGESPALKHQENIAKQSFAGAALAKQGANRQAGAQAGYDMQAVNSIGSRASRNLEGERSKMMSGIASAKQNAAQQAQGQLASFGMQDRTQKFNESKYADSKKQDDWNRMLQYYDPSTPEGLDQLRTGYSEMFGGEAPDFNVLKEQRDYLNKKRTQDITSGDQSIASQDIQNASAKLGLDQQSANNVINAINQGATKEYIQQQFGVSLSDEQYNSFKQQYSEQRQQAELQLSAQELQNIAAEFGIEQNKVSAVIGAINQGATKDLIESQYGVSLSDEQYNSIREQYSEQRQQAELQLSAQELQNISTEFGIEQNKVSAVVGAINQGITKDLIQQQFGVNLTDEQYNSIREQYSEQRQQANLMLSAQELQNLSTQFGLDSAKSQAVVNAINQGATKDYVENQFGVSLSDDQYESMKEQYGQKITLGTLSINAADLQNKASEIGVDNAEMNKIVTAVNSGASRAFINNKFGTNLSTQDYNDMKEQYLQKIEIGNLQITSQDIANTSAELGVDITKSKAIAEAVNQGSTKGYVESQFGISITDDQYNGLKRRYSQTVAAGDAELEGLRNSVGDQKFNSVVSRISAGAGVESINNELGTDLSKADYDNMWEATETYVRKQGLSMEQASLYGYKDESGNHVKGGLEVAQEKLGLETKNLDMQQKELFGYTKKDGTTVKGKYDLLSEEDKRAADQMYGYLVKDRYGNPIGRVKGSLELSNAASDIQKQGLDLETAQIKGYIDPLTGSHVKGAIQLNAERQGLEVSSLYGYHYDPETGDVVTDQNEIRRRGDELQKVDGSLTLAAKQFGLAESDLELQRNELFGYYDKETDMWQPGKMEYLASEDRRAATQMYGYDDYLPDGTKVHYPGSLELAKDEAAIRKQGMSIDEAKLFGYEKNGKHIKGTLELEGEKTDMLRDEYEDQKGSNAGVALASHFNLMKNTKGYDFNGDKQAEKLLQDYWESSTGTTSDYDKDWADRQYEASTISDIDAAISELESESWFNALDKDEQEKTKKLVSLAAKISITGGVQPVMNDDGDIVELKDESGDSIWKEQSGYSAEVSQGVSGNNEIAVPKFRDSYEEVKDDPRFSELYTEGKISATKFKESGARTLDEYLDYSDATDKYGTTNTYKINSGGNGLLDPDGKPVQVKDLPKTLKNASDPNSPNHKVYKELVNSAKKINDFNIHIKSGVGNKIANRPKNGTLINYNGRLLYVQSQGRSGNRLTGEDNITFVDVSTGQGKIFDGRLTGENSLGKVQYWVKNLE